MSEKRNDTTPYSETAEPGLTEDPMPQTTAPSETPETGSEEPPEPTSDPNVQPDEEAALAEIKEEPVITIRGLCKSFKDHDVLRGVDLHVKKGENLVILGKSGTGKSVLIKCLVGLEWPDSGTINIFGQDISTLNYGEMNALRLRVGFLFQNAALYDSMTVRENLAFPLRQHKKNMTAEKKEAL